MTSLRDWLRVATDSRAVRASMAAIRGRRPRRERTFTLLEGQIERINKFPDQNPNPVLRMAVHG